MGSEPTEPPRLEIDLFGPLSIRVNGTPLPPMPSRKGAYLLALLTLRHGREVERDYLAGLLWPDSDQEKALFNLRQMLLRVRQALGDEAWRIDAPSRHTLRLDLRGASADVVEFDAELSRSEPEAWRTAVARYRGPFLEGCSEQWAFSPRREREDAYVAALEKLSAEAVSHGDYAAAQSYLRRVIAVDPLHEGAYRSLMQALASAGEYAEATHLYRELRVLLQRELNASPAPDTVETYQKLRSLGEAPVQASVRAKSHVVEMRDEKPVSPVLLEAGGGSVPLDSRFYIARPADDRLDAAIANLHSVILLKGTRQTGKTSLLVRGLEAARAMGAVTVYTNVNALDAAVLETREALYRALMGEIADQLDLDVSLDEVWNASRAANTNLDRYLRREVLGGLQGPLIWVLDEVDRLFVCDFRNEVFALFRSWHDRRAMDPSGAWSRLTLALSYSTEAHLFITDLNQSPFNVGTRLTLEDFTRDQVADLNARYGRPLRTDAEVDRFHSLVGGHPYLVRRGLDAMVSDRLSIGALEAQAAREDGLYGGHLRHMFQSVVQDPEMTELLRAVLRGKDLTTNTGFYRLFSSGVLATNLDQPPRLRCKVYESFLAHRLL